MDKYKVIIFPRAYKNLDDIYSYIANELYVPNAALKLIDKLEQAIFSLEEMPFRFPQRKRGAYANKGYRQIFVDNFTVIFRVSEKTKEVFVVTVRYSKSDFWKLK